MATSTNDTASEITRLRAQVENQAQRLQVLEGITSLSGASTKTICDYILASIVRLTNSEYGFYGFVDDSESEMIMHAWSGRAMADCDVLDKPAHFAVDAAGVWAEAIRDRCPLILNDYAMPHPGKKGLPQGHVMLTNMLVVPDVSDGKITAVVAVSNASGDYGQHEIDQIRGFLASVRAITDAKRAEEALYASESRYRTLFQHQAHGAYLQHADGQIVDVNSAALEILGLSRDEFLARSWDAQEWAFKDESGTEVASSETPAFRAIETAQPVTGCVLCFLNELTGRTVWVEMYAVPEFRYGDTEPYRAVVTLHDISERRRTAEALREREVLFSTLVENGVDLITLTDAEGHVVYISPQCNDVVGYPPAKFQGVKLPDIIHPGDLERCMRAWDDTMSGQDLNGLGMC